MFSKLDLLDSNDEYAVESRHIEDEKILGFQVDQIFIKRLLKTTSLNTRDQIWRIWAGVERNHVGFKYWSPNYKLDL